MRKKQILATMVMLSLLQGSVYAADKITEADFDEDTNSLTLASNDVGPIYIIDNKEKDYIRLQPENHTMEPIIVQDCKILGKVAGVFRKM